MRQRVFRSAAWIAVLGVCLTAAGAEKPAAAVAGLGKAAVVESAPPLELEQIISREDPSFSCAQASLSIGLDGMVYLTSAGHDSGYILRIGRDGRDKVGGASVPAIHNATADRNGLIAGAHGHFSHQVALYDREFRKVLAVTDFLVSDQVGWDAAGSVEVGPSGDFYGLDQHRERIVRIRADGKVVQAYGLPHWDKCPAQGFRVCERTQALYLLFWGRPQVACVGFDGKLRWERPAGCGTNTYEGDSGGFDVDADGTLYTIGAGDSVIHKIGPGGQPVGQITLAIPAGRKPVGGIHGLRLWQGEALLRGRHPTELFQVYDLATGQYRRSVSIDHERLTAVTHGGPWLAGEPVDFQIRFDGGGRQIKPRWRVWARPLGILDYRELELKATVPFSSDENRDSPRKLQVPADFAGFYQIKVTPETTPWQTGATAAEYKVQTLIEVRAAGARGSAAAATPLGRAWFARGEEIPLVVYTRGITAAKGTELRITFGYDPQGLGATAGSSSSASHTAGQAGGASNTAGQASSGTQSGSGSQLATFRPIAEGTARFDPAVKELHFTLPKSLSAQLRPGRYWLGVSGKGLTCVGQPVWLGPGEHGRDASATRAGLWTMIYGDYRQTYPQASVWDAPDIATAWFQRYGRLGFNMMVDRLGHPGEMGAFSLATPRAEVDTFYKSLAVPLAEAGASKKPLAADPLAVAPEKLYTLPALLQALAGYGAEGISQMAILMGNDAGLPLGGPGFDSRKPEQDLNDLKVTTEALRGYPAFRGWSWSSNWWVFGDRGAGAGKTAAEKAACTAALKRAADTGAWDDVLDRVSGYRLAYAVDAQAMFNRTLRELAPGMVTAVACPFRNVESYPPITLSNVDETDLQAQWEQVALPYHGPFGVDFYKRPGKKAWGHPEVWNDAGTGDQVLTTIWQMLMRGADGVGCSDPVPQWQFALAGNTDDPRTSWNGLLSVYRGLNGVLKQYGPWLAELHGSDPVAIVASGRMYKIDDWVGATGRHFARVMEAYVACLHAHRPASIVFAEDLGPDTLRRYKAVLLVGQTVEPEPALAAALKAARGAGVAVFADGTCRPGLVKDLTPLALSFDHWERDPSLAADDHAYWRTAGYAKAAAPILARALAGVPPPAEVENPEVFLSQRRAEEGRYLFVVNNTAPGELLGPGYLWRVTLGCATLLPQVVPVKLSGLEGQAVYDVFAGKQVRPAEGVVQADCRNMPARIFAVLPAAIAGVRLQAPARCDGGQNIAWKVEVLDAAGRVIPAAVPVRVRLLAADGTLLDERYASASSHGAGGELVVPLGLPRGELTLEATELLSGRSASGKASLKLRAAPTRDLPLDLAAPAGVQPRLPAPGPMDNSVSAGAPDPDFAPAEQSFGPHVRDLVVTHDGKLAVMNTMNWDHNLYGLDVESGHVRWRQRLGHYFAFEPVALGDGVAVQGFDLRSAEGYHLYLVGPDGSLQRRFALFGLPQRLPHRFVPALVRDHVNSFAVGDGGRWIATAGDLGLAVWSAEGKPLWQQDWYTHQRHAGKLLALDAATLLVVEGTTATAYSADAGGRKWRQALGPSGEIRIARTSADGGTCGLYNIADGGRLHVLRQGHPVRVIPTPAEDFSLSPDGSLIAVVAVNQLKLYSVTDGLQWIVHGDDLMHFPRFSGDGRLVATSGLGTVYVTDLAGRTLCQKDAGALAVPAWLADGGLLLATWEGSVCRLDKTYGRRWHTRLTPQAADIRGTILAADQTPTARIDTWSNAEKIAIAGEAPVPRPTGTVPFSSDENRDSPRQTQVPPGEQPANLLAQTKPLIQLVTAQGPTELTHTPRQTTAMLYDGKAEPPAEAWIPWEMLGTFAETSPVNYLIIDAFRTQMQVSGVTLIEDPRHPESWLRDTSIDYWDAAREAWAPIQPMLSDAAVHTHRFARPVAAARFRLVLPWGACGNVRLAQIVFHGRLLRCSHPDVVAKRPLAVLFDEQEDIRHDLYSGGGQLALAVEGAYSGGRCLTLTPPAGGQAVAGPPFQQQFGETIRNWDFEIAENPEPGQYRYLQFAFRALSPETKGITLRVSESNYGGPSIAAGEPTAFDGATVVRQTGTPPRDWQVVRVDLWAAAKRPWRIRSLTLGVRGGGAAFDQIVLGRTPADLPKQ